MKKILSCVLALSIGATLQGCAKKPEQPTSLTLMQEVNDKNVLHADYRGRLWYQVSPSFFKDGNGDGMGDYSGLISYLDYLSDGDENTFETDLSVSGIFLGSIFASENQEEILNYTSLDQNLGSEDDLKNLCAQAAERNMPVMVSFPLGKISVNSSYFQDAKNALAALGEEQPMSDADGGLLDMFYFSETKEDDSWVPLEGTRFFYKINADSNSPAVHFSAGKWKEILSQAFSWFTDLGINGFYLSDITTLYNEDEEQATEFVNWCVDAIASVNPRAVVVAAASTYNPAMNGIHCSFFDIPASGAEGYLARAVTGSLPATEAGKIITNLSQNQSSTAWAVNNADNSLDLLKSPSRIAQYKMMLALDVLSSGEVFLYAGDELGALSQEYDFVSELMEDSGKNKVSENTDSENQSAVLTFGDLEEQREDGNSIYNYLVQAIRLRDSYQAISSGKTTIREDISNDHILALEKSLDDSHIIEIYNLSDQPQTIDLSAVTLMNLPAELGGVLLSQADSVQYENGVLSLPPYSVAVMK